MQNGRESFHERIKLKLYPFNLRFISITFTYFKSGNEMMPRLLLGEVLKVGMAKYTITARLGFK